MQATQLKHADTVNQIINQIIEATHESWMSDDDRKQMKSTLFLFYGRKLSDDLQKGIEMGVSIEQQIEASKKLIQASL